MTDLILASQSPSRKALLEQLKLNFRVLPSHIDETQQPGELPKALVARLALEKAMVQAKKNRESVIIGADVVACLDQVSYGKPKTYEQAFKVLSYFSGRCVDCLCGVALVHLATGKQQVFVEKFSIVYRSYSERNLKQYLEKEQPLECAGGLKFEGLGIALIEYTQGRDPSSVEGLPLMWLSKYLPEFGVEVL